MIASGASPLSGVVETQPIELLSSRRSRSFQVWRELLSPPLFSQPSEVGAIHYASYITRTTTRPNVGDINARLPKHLIRETGANERAPLGTRSRAAVPG